MTVPATTTAPAVAPAAPEVAVVPAVTETAAAPPAPPKAASRLTEEQVLASFDAEFDALTAKTKAEIKEGKQASREETAPSEKVVTKPEDEVTEETAEVTEEIAEAKPADTEEWEEGIVPPSPEDALPNDERSALKAIKDPKIRRQFARAHFLVKGYERAGMRLSDISKYIAAAPTPEILDERVTRAGQLDSFVEEFASAKPDAIVRVAEVLRQTSQEGWTTLVDAIIDNVHIVRPEKLRPLGNKFFRAVVSNMRAQAEKDGDLVLADHADGVEQFLGLKARKDGAGPRDETQMDPELRRRLEEADEIQRRDKQREAQSVQQAYQAFNGAVVQEATAAGVNLIKDWIDENCAAYSNDAKAELFDRMASSTLQQVQGNSHVAKTLRRLIDDGPGDEEHLKRCADYLVRTSRSVFVQVAPQVLTKFQKVFGEASARRAEKVARARTARDIGSSGAAVVASEGRLSGKGKHPDDVLKEFDARG